MRRTFILLLFLVLAWPATAAVQPDEILDDPAKEARARALAAQLRCMVCQNQSIDDSNAELARDLRLLVRDRILAGDADHEVMDYVVSRYGEFVLLRPRFNARNALLWSAPVIFLLGGGTLAFVTLRNRSRGRSAALTPEEEAALKGVLDERE